jgi:hypothetical protein
MQLRTRSKTSVLLGSLVLAILLPTTACSEPLSRTAVQTLSGSAFVLPDDLAAAVDILVVGFTRKAGNNTGPWTERLRRDFKPEDGYAVYPVAVLAGVPGMFRSFALNSMRGSVPKAEQGRFLIVDHDESAWRDLAGYKLPDEPYIIAIDKQGNVLARASGLFDEKSYQDAAARIRDAAGGKS